MRWFRAGRRTEEPEFVAAGPGLLERITEAWQAPGRRRWLHLAVITAAAPYRAAAAVIDGCVRLCRFGSAEVFQGFRARKLSHLVQGVPALVAAMLAAVVAVAAASPDELSGAYRAAAGQAFVAARWEDARLCYERLFRLDGGSAETRLGLGLTLERLGDIQGAEALIGGVADGDAGGDARANRWVAVRLLQDRATFGDVRRLRELHRHLSSAEAGLPRDPAIALGLAKYYVAVGRPADAAPKLAAAAEVDPALNLDLARLYAAVGRNNEAGQALLRGESLFRVRLEKDPFDQQARLLEAAFAAAAGRDGDALKLLVEGDRLSPGGPFRPVIARLYIAAYDRLSVQSPRDPRAMIGVLREALGYDPKSVEAALRLSDFEGVAAGVKSGNSAPAGEDAESEASRLLEGLLASGEQPPAVHMALGLRASRGGRAGEALWHFQRAYDLDPSLTGVANNLAWVLSHSEKPDLGRALELIQTALKKAPAEPSYLDTRGEIYLKMGRLEDALGDFERALPAMRDDPRIHRSLADVYERLGRAELAEAHRREGLRLENSGTDRAAHGAAAAPAHRRAADRSPAQAGA